MSLAVAAAAGLLAAFSDTFGRETDPKVFQATFLCVGLMTTASAWIFWQLADDDRTGAKELMFRRCPSTARNCVIFS